MGLLILVAYPFLSCLRIFLRIPAHYVQKIEFRRLNGEDLSAFRLDGYAGSNSIEIEIEDLAGEQALLGISEGAHVSGKGFI